MVSNLLGRYLWEINELEYHPGGMTLEELNQRWRKCGLYDGKEIIRKTWYAHRKQIGVQFGLDIEVDKPTNKYYIKYPEDVGKTNLQNWMLNSFAVGNMLMQGKDLKDRIEYEKIPSGYEYLTDLIEAMRDNKVITITYQSFWNGKKATFDVKPYALKVFRQRWYLIADNTKFKQIRVYSLDRINGLEITAERFKMPKDFDVEKLFSPYIGVSLDNVKTERVLIKVFDKQVLYFRSLPLHHSQREVEIKDKYSVFEYYIKPTYEFEQEILSHGEKVEVLKPTSLREKIKARLLEAAGKY